MAIPTMPPVGRMDLWDSRSKPSSNADGIDAKEVALGLEVVVSSESATVTVVALCAMLFRDVSTSAGIDWPGVNT